MGDRLPMEKRKGVTLRALLARYLLMTGALLALLTAMLLFVCYRRFRQYGGPDHYTPPEPENFPNAH